MLRHFHALKKSEEGQTLVLAAIFGVLLMMCVLGTINLGRTVYDKIQLQNAADETAYSQAAIEARVMNYTAYTNRAMVVHYASIMSATSYLSWVHFMWGGFKPVLEALDFLPYVGEITEVLQDVLQTLVDVLDYAVWALAPVLSGLNVLLWAVQEGAWLSTYLKLTQAPTGWPEAHGGDKVGAAYQPIWPTLIPLANATVFSQARGNLTMVQNLAQTALLFANSTDPTVQMARMHMIEIANSARQPWVAYGDRATNPSISPLARHWKWKIGPLSTGGVSRTELGSFNPGGGIVGVLTKALPQIWSGEKWQGDLKVPLVGGHVDFLTFVAVDSFEDPPLVYPYKNAYFDAWSVSGGLFGRIISGLLPGLKSALQAAVKGQLPDPQHRLWFMSPYVSFAPAARSTPGVGPLGQVGNFGQPDVLVGLAKQRADINREAASNVYAKKFSWRAGSGTTGTVDFTYTAADWPQIPGVPGGLQLLHEGLNAFAAAQVYYHRPGEWREQPNLFNPLWGARLMPITQSNVAARLGLSAVPMLNQLLTH